MSTVGRNEDAIRSYIRQQEKEDARLDQLSLWCRHHLQVVPKSGPRQRPRTAASSGSSRNAPGFAGGYLLLSIASVLSEGNAVSGHKACIPQAVNMGQIVDTSVRYIKDNATADTSTAAVLIAKSLERSFPCP